MLLSTFAQAAALLASIYHANAASISRRATTCNGYAELCSRSYGNVTFVGAHDSYAVGQDLAANQDHDVTQQLKDGIRMLQVQAHQQSDGIHLCHTSCFLQDGGLASKYLTSVQKWLTKNPNDVVTLLIVNIDNLPPTDWQKLYQAVGLEAISYSPPHSPLTASEWPSLNDMISSGKRLVTFLDHQADFTQVPYLIDEFSNMWETPFDAISPEFPCTVNRTNGDPTTQLNLINHYLDHTTAVAGSLVPVPFKEQLNVTNAIDGPGSLGQEVQTCLAAHGRVPNFLLVDFYEFGGGSVFQVAAMANGVPYNPSTIASPVATGSTPSSTSSSSGTISTPLSSAAYQLRFPKWVGAPWVVVAASVFLGTLVTG